MVLYGVAYAIASLGCTIGPFLVVTATTLRSGDLTTGIAAYALGMGVVVRTLVIAAALATDTAATTFRRAMPAVARGSVGLLVLVGAYVAWYVVYELRIARGGPIQDPVVGAPTSLQNEIAGLVDRIDGTGFLVALATLVLLVLASRRGRGRRRTGTRDPRKTSAEHP